LLDGVDDAFEDGFGPVDGPGAGDAGVEDYDVKFGECREEALGGVLDGGEEGEVELGRVEGDAVLGEGFQTRLAGDVGVEGGDGVSTFLRGAGGYCEVY